MSRVGLALSGGVDSTVAALLLREAGHEVVALTMAIGAGPQRALAEAPAAAKALGIEHHVIDVSAAFERAVLAPAARAYAAGRTPNPCATCNAAVKFPALWRAARALGCQALATGHYARLIQDGPDLLLAQGVDEAKSQAYFLARLRPELLARLVLPLGGMRKDEVRAMAQAKGLPAAGRPESQDGCFLPPGGWDQIIGQRGLVRPGPIEDAQGRVIGRHGGLHRYTVGQRRGLGLALGWPAYVLALDGRRAAVTVGPKDLLATKGFVARGQLWRKRPTPGQELLCRVRYSTRGTACLVEDRGADDLQVSFLCLRGAVAPGQLAVFFVDDRVLGSAWISQSILQRTVTT